MGYDRKYLLWALAYAVAGMGLGVVMGASHDHSQHVTHAHILLVGFVTSLAYGIIHKLWLGHATSALASIQFLLHQAGAITMFAGLLLLFGQVLPPEQLDPMLAISSIVILAGAAAMLAMVLKSPRTPA